MTDHLSQLPQWYIDLLWEVTKQQFPGIEEHIQEHRRLLKTP